LTVIRGDAGIDSIWSVRIDGSTPVRLPLEPFTSFSQISAKQAVKGFTCLASSPALPTCVLHWDGYSAHIIRDADAGGFDTGDISIPEPVNWLTKDGDTVYGMYFAPRNAHYCNEGLPPVIIHAHSGPTRQVQADFSFDTSFFTSRGYGFLSVNYRGSTGYGKSYRDSLNGWWGIRDVEDVISGADFLVKTGRADPLRLVLKGSSAGGLTVLNALIHQPDRFQAAVCAYAVTHLNDIVEDTIKFESRYYDSLVGILPEFRQRYDERSPLNYADCIRTPIALFHGTADEVVPVSQARSLAKVIRENEVPLHFHLFRGEGHGWRKPGTMRTYYREILRFLTQTLSLE
jgi:dipeptidyl aminopeptidase/acylaminoacyl peptidase